MLVHKRRGRELLALRRDDGGHGGGEERGESDARHSSRECVGKREWVLSTGDLVYVERHRQRPCLGGRKEDVGLTTRGKEEGIIPSLGHRVQTQTLPRSWGSKETINSDDDDDADAKNKMNHG